MKRLWGILRQLSKDRGGVAYLEFMLALPILLLLFVGAVDLTRLVLVHQKIDRAAFTVGDLITQLNVEVRNVCPTLTQLRGTVVKDIIKPFSFKNDVYGILVTSVIRHAGAPRIEWRADGGANVQQGDSEVGGGGQFSPANLPAGFNLQVNERVIVTEMWYQFSPLLMDWNFEAAGTRVRSIQEDQLKKYFFMRGRNSNINDDWGQGTIAAANGC